MDFMHVYFSGNFMLLTTFNENDFIIFMDYAPTPYKCLSQKIIVPLHKAISLQFESSTEFW
jgi:hypothetical protein